MKVITYFSENTRMVISEDLNGSGVMRARTEIRLGTPRHPHWQESAIDYQLDQDLRKGLDVNPFILWNRPVPLGRFHGSIIYYSLDLAKKSNHCFIIKDTKGNKQFMTATQAAGYMLQNDFELGREAMK